MKMPFGLVDEHQRLFLDKFDEQRNRQKDDTMTRAQSPKPLARAIFPALSSVIDDAPGIRVKK